MNKIREAVKVNNGKLVYVVQLTTESGNEKLQLYYNEGGYNNTGIRFEDNAFAFDRYNVFDIRTEGHRIAKEIFLTHLQAEIKTKILELKQLELVLDELGLVGVIRKTISENATMLLDVKDEIIEETIKATDKIIETKTNKKVLKQLEKVKEETNKIVDAKIEEQVRPIARNMKEYDKLYEDLCKSVEPLKKYYNIDKIKSYSVYIWNKSDDIEESENLFDIQSNRIIYYEDVKIIEEAKPIIKKIQKKLQKIKEYLGSDN